MSTGAPANADASSGSSDSTGLTTALCSAPDSDRCSTCTSALCADTLLGATVATTCPALCGVCHQAGEVEGESDDDDDSGALVIIIVVVVCVALLVAVAAAIAFVYRRKPGTAAGQNANGFSMSFTNGAFAQQVPPTNDGEMYDEIAQHVGAGVPAPAAFAEPTYLEPRATSLPYEAGAAPATEAAYHELDDAPGATREPAYDQVDVGVSLQAEGNQAVSVRTALYHCPVTRTRRRTRCAEFFFVALRPWRGVICWRANSALPTP